MLSTLAIVLAVCLVVVAVAAIGEVVRRGRRLTKLEDAVASLSRSWSEDGSSRGRVCAAAQQVAGAELALVAEPSRRGDALVITATADATALGGTHIPLEGESSLLARAFLTGAPFHLKDIRNAPVVSARLLAATRARSLHVRPIAREGRIVGVLAIAWRDKRRSLLGTQAELIAMLAEEAGRAIERDAHHALLNRHARTDELTALPNRRAWDEAIVTEMARSQRTGEPLCVALLDLDYFKAFNDTYGHPAGDAHLRRTSAAWRRELRAIDVLARYGGEEFGVLLPSCDLARAQEVIDRVRAATPNDQTASAGVVSYDGRESRDSLLSRADAALYRAKHAGRATTVTV